jgi:hypothetical protein
MERLFLHLKAAKSSADFPRTSGFDAANDPCSIRAAAVIEEALQFGELDSAKSTDF